MKHIQKITGTIVFLVFILMVAAYFNRPKEEEMLTLSNQVEHAFNVGWLMVSPDNEEKLEVNLPYSRSDYNSDTIMFQHQLPEEYAGLMMHFSCQNANVRVLLDGEVLYQKESYNINTASDHYVNIPYTVQDGENWGELCIELTIQEHNRETVLGNVMVEAGSTTIIGLVGMNLADIVCCLLLVITAMILFVLALIRWYTGQSRQGELYLGLFGLVAGIHCFIGTDTFYLFFDMPQVYVIEEYLMLLLPLFLTLYFEQNIGNIFPRRFARLLCVVNGCTVIQILLGLLGIWNLIIMEDISGLVVAAVCTTVVVSLLQTKDKNIHYQPFLQILSVFVLLSGEVEKVVLNTFSMYTYAKMAALYSTALFGLMLASIHVFQISKEYRLDAEEKAKETERQNTLLAQAKQEADTARQEALAANKAKGKFLAQMSHEIRTPINAVLGMDEMILRESKEQAVREYAMDIYTAGQSLLSLINDILDFSKIDSGKMELVPAAYEVSSLIHGLVNMAARRAADKSLQLEVAVDQTIPSRLYGDDVRIRQVLINILTNAVKYTHEGNIWFRVRGHVTGDTAVLHFEVEDTGIGIREEDLPKLAAEFERIEEDKNHNIEGTGLGMSITIQLLALLGSKLHVQSEYGKGSIFYFDLEQKIVDPAPIGDFELNVQQAAETFCYEASLYAPDAKILVVDDNAVNRKVLRNLLKETAIQVTEAASGAACLQLIQENQYDLIFLDHMMPEMDGIETLHRMKALSGSPCKDTPVIVLTANAVFGAKEFYLSQGFDDFLSKPIVPDKLEAMIQKRLLKSLLCTAPGPVIKRAARAASSELHLEELPVVEGVDWSYAWLHLPDMELLERTVKEFYDQIDAAADCLERSYKQCTEEHDPEPYRIQVHAMKSLAATIGIIPLSGIAKVLESAAKDSKIKVIMSVTAVFLEEWRSYKLKLQGVFGIGTSVGKKVTDDTVVQALVEMVRISMQEMEFDQADECMKQLRTYDFPTEIAQNIHKLADAVTNLDLEESDRLANLLSAQMAGRKAAYGAVSE